ncbi:hypothetical protein [Montanilutibacter psychrotolerans]|uniref:hypothetical protein n=1 Tax=Montanilutibacter psychrotolerans TaxID=1327343 RepID=UPI001680BAD2|nr:hypothetical protein [Lysobacter psychrotolerans]
MPLVNAVLSSNAFAARLGSVESAQVMAPRKSIGLVGLACILASPSVFADWRYENIVGAEHAVVTSDNTVEVKSYVDDSVVSLRAELRLVNGPHGTRSWLALDPTDDGFAQIYCEGSSLCQISVAFDQGQPADIGSCYSDGPYSTGQAVKFDASKYLVDGLHKSTSVEIIAPVSDGDSTSQVAFRFSVGALKFKASHRRDVCEGDFAGDHGAVER